VQRPIIVPLWLVIILAISPYISMTVIPYIQEMRRDGAVVNINDHNTIEHNQIAQLVVDAVKRVVGIILQENEQEDKKLDVIQNNTEASLELLKNGTR